MSTAPNAIHSPLSINDRMARGPARLSRTASRMTRWLAGGALRRALVDIAGHRALCLGDDDARYETIVRERCRELVDHDEGAADATAPMKGEHGSDAEWAICHRRFARLDDDRSRVDLLRRLGSVAKHGVIVEASIHPLAQGHTGGGQCAITLLEARELIAVAGLELRSVHFACWPFSTTAWIVCSKASRAALASGVRGACQCQ